MLKCYPREFLAVIFHRLDDDLPRMIMGDWLQENGYYEEGVRLVQSKWIPVDQYTAQICAVLVHWIPQNGFVGNVCRPIAQWDKGNKFDNLIGRYITPKQMYTVYKIYHGLTPRAYKELNDYVRSIFKILDKVKKDDKDRKKKS